MFNLRWAREDGDARAVLAAIERSQAMIEFRMDGTIVNANQNFLSVMGYSLEEIRGRHHSLFVEPSYRDSDEYRAFWAALNRGEYQTAQFRRIGKSGREVWIEASYNPVPGRDGRPVKVVKFATDVSNAKAEYANLLGQIEAIGRSVATIEFALDGQIMTANRNFLDLTGYSLEEIQGRHHSLFVDPAYAASDEYRQFWQALNRGVFRSERFRRVGKGGKDIWIQAAYNPILDLNGRLCKVVKFAIDITAQSALLTEFKSLIDKNFGQIEGAIGRSAEQAEQTSRVVREATDGIQGIAANAEELATSVREIASMMERSRTATESVHSQTEAADQAAGKLTETSEAMGGIIALIQEVAGQINLLALNATIESARAGDAGKGFAVVAGEVKNLAQQAASATNRIATEIQKLQSVSREVVAALASIGELTAQVRDYVSGTANAVERQSAVTQTVSIGMQTAVASIAAINDNMAEISTAVSQASDAVGDTRSAAGVLVR